MPPSTPSALGQRIATIRKMRNLTQRQLADAALVSASMLKKIEEGARHPSDDVLHHIAHALDTTPERLAGSPGHTNSRIHDAIPAIRAATVAPDLPDDGPVRPIRELRTAVEHTTRLRLRSHYATLAEDIPPLLEELARALQQHTGRDRQQAAALLTTAYRSADAIAYKYGHRDLSARLIDLMRWTSQLADDPNLQATTAYVRTEVFFATGTLATGLRALHTALDAAPPTSTDLSRAATAALHMRAAVVAGRMRDTTQAREHLAEAHQLAGTIPEGVYHGTQVGPDTLQIHTLSVAVELGDQSDLQQAARAASVWAPPATMPEERRSHYYIDLARAQMRIGQPQHAWESLQVARRIAPQHVREHGQVREELARLVRLDRRGDEQLRAYARWAGIV